MSPPAEACPVCGKPVAVGFAPFCSKRCADIDLGRWLKGSYVIPGAPGSSESTPEKPPGNDADED